MVESWGARLRACAEHVNNTNTHTTNKILITSPVRKAVQSTAVSLENHVDTNIFKSDIDHSQSVVYGCRWLAVIHNGNRQEAT